MNSLTVLQLQPHPASLALCRATVTSKRVGRSSAYFAMLLVICSQPQDELPSARRTGTLNDLLQREAHLPPIQPHQSNPTTLPTSPRRAARGRARPLGNDDKRTQSLPLQRPVDSDSAQARTSCAPRPPRPSLSCAITWLFFLRPLRTCTYRTYIIVRGSTQHTLAPMFP